MGGVTVSVCHSVVLSVFPVRGFCREVTFWATQPFVIQRGMVIHHHKALCHPETLGCYLQGQGHSEGLMIKICFCYVFWTSDSFATKLSLMVYPYKPRCPVKIRVQTHGHSKHSKCQCLSGPYFLNHWTPLHNEQKALTFKTEVH